MKFKIHKIMVLDIYDDDGEQIDSISCHDKAEAEAQKEGWIREHKEDD